MIDLDCWHVCSDHRAQHAPRSKHPGVDRPHIHRCRVPGFSHVYFAMKLQGQWLHGEGGSALAAYDDLARKLSQASESHSGAAVQDVA
jgi:hypothetical protein